MRIVRLAPPVALAALLAGAWLPPDGSGLPICWVRLWTGLPCLTCGLTRSFLHTLHGDWAAAFRLHPLGPPLVALCVLAAAAPVLPAPARERWQEWLGGYSRWSAPAAYALLAILVLNAAYRLWWIFGLGRPSLW